MRIWYILQPYPLELIETLTYLKSLKGKEDSKIINDFYLKFISPFFGETGDVPSFNPFQNQEFQIKNGLKDSYLFFGKLTRHLLASAKLTKILETGHLLGSIKFENVKLVSRNGVISKYNYYHFYESMWDYVDIRRSTFRYINHISNEFLGLVKFDTVEEYNLARKNVKVNQIVVFDELVINGINDYDCFMILNYSESKLFISDKIYKELKENNISVDVEALTKFKISGE